MADQQDDAALAAEQPRPDRRQALVAAAFQRIASEGFEGLRTRDVAGDAGVNIATLHYYFPTKEALIRGVIGHAMQRFAATIPSQGSGLEQLQGHLRALSRLIKDDQQLWAVMGELVLRAPRDPDLAQTFHQSDAFWHRTLRDLIVRCIMSGAANDQLDADDAAALTIAAIRGLSLPTVGGVDVGRVNRVFRQLERMLGLPE